MVILNTTITATTTTTNNFINLMTELVLSI